MEINEYQKKAHEFAVYPNVGNNLPYVALGLAGEAGEVAEKVKKLIRDLDYEMNKEFVQTTTKELGDVAWYLAEACTTLGITLESVLKLNIEKLSSRQERGVLQGSGDNR